MLDEKYQKAYHSIKANSDLKEKILLRAEENFRDNVRTRPRFKAIYYAAACAVIVMGILMFAMQISRISDTELLYGGQVISATPTALEESTAVAVSFGAKNLTAEGLPLEISAKGETKISVTDGELQIFDKKRNELLFIGTDFTTSETVVLFWNLSSATNTSPCLITDNNKAYSEYVLEESDENGYIIRLATRNYK